MKIENLICTMLVIVISLLLASCASYAIGRKLFYRDLEKLDFSKLTEEERSKYARWLEKYKYRASHEFASYFINISSDRVDELYLKFYKKLYEES